MTEEFFTISFDHEGVHYDGRVSPLKKDRDGTPRSYHVVLNNVFFGHVNNDGRNWLSSEQRPEELVKKVGEVLSQKLKAQSLKPEHK
jgi:hypothetical protein